MVNWPVENYGGREPLVRYVALLLFFGRQKHKIRRTAAVQRYRGTREVNTYNGQWYDLVLNNTTEFCAGPSRSHRGDWA